MKTITIGPWTVPLTKNGRVLILRTCQPDGRSYGSFRWPTNVGALCKAPDWDPSPRIGCGRGLHGLLMGLGDQAHLNMNSKVLWMVVSADPKEVVCASDREKVRFSRCRVECVGTLGEVHRHLLKLDNLSLHLPGYSDRQSLAHAHAITAGRQGDSRTTGDKAHAIAVGILGHATTFGQYSDASTVGDGGVSDSYGRDCHASCTGSESESNTRGPSSHAIQAGLQGRATTVGLGSHASAMGNMAKATTRGPSSHASVAGSHGRATSMGLCSHASAVGDCGDAGTHNKRCVAMSAGRNGRVQGAVGNILFCVEWRGQVPVRGVTARVGQAGIKPNVWYKARKGKLVVCKD